MIEVRNYPYDVCDFCSSAEPTWVFPANSYHDRLLNVQSINNWLACDECATLINQDRWGKLAERSLRNPAVAALVNRATRKAILDNAVRMHKDFQKHRTGEPYRR